MEEVQSSISDLEQITQNKKAQLANINTEIEATIENIKDINNNIQVLSTDIANFTCANNLYQELDIANVSSRKLKDCVPEKEYELDDAHLEIINKKRNQIEPLRHQATKLKEDQELLLQNLMQSRLNLYETTNRVMDLTEEIRKRTLSNFYLSSKLNWLEMQLKDVTSQCRTWEDMKREAEQAIAIIKERADSVNTDEGGRLDLEKTIISLQNQLQSIESQISDAREKINVSKDTKKAVSQNGDAEERRIEETVNWETERKDLKAELASLTKEIEDMKKGVTKKEKSADVANNSLAKYAPLVSKWKSSPEEIEIESDKPLTALYSELENVRKETEGRHAEQQSRLTALMTENAKLAKSVGRKRQKLENVILAFHAEEAANEKQIAADREYADKEEERLLRVIEEAKLKVAQKYLQI